MIISTKTLLGLIFTTLFLGMAPLGFAQETSSDDQIIAQHLSTLNSPESKADGDIYSNSTVISSDDGLLKIYSFTGENCSGVRCNPICATFLHTNDASLSGKKLNLDGVKKIQTVLLKDGKKTYLIFTEFSASPAGANTFNYYGVHHVKLQGDSLAHIDFVYPRPLISYQDQSSFSIETQWDMLDEKTTTFLTYDQKSKQLSYFYILDKKDYDIYPFNVDQFFPGQTDSDSWDPKEGLSQIPGELLYVWGYFKFNGKQFTHETERVQFKTRPK